MLRLLLLVLGNPVVHGTLGSTVCKILTPVLWNLSVSMWIFCLLVVFVLMFLEGSQYLYFQFLFRFILEPMNKNLVVGGWLGCG